MKRASSILILIALAVPCSVYGRERAFGYCEQGGHVVVTQGLNSTNNVQQSFKSCTVTVYDAGTTNLSTIYADNLGTVKGNPFTSDANGYWFFYANNGRYDVHFSNSDILNPYTQGDYLLCDPQDSLGSFSCTGGGIAGAHNLLSTTHLDTIPASPPARGSLITGQNLTSPSGATPAWAQLTLGANGDVLTSNGTDAIWAPGGGTPACTTSVQGSLAVGVQTCAGEKELQGLNGNPTVVNLRLTPSPDLALQNLYSGEASSSYANPDSGFLGDFFHSGRNAMLMLNGGSIKGSNTFGLDNTLTIYNQDNTAGGWDGILSARAICNSDSTNGALLIGNEQCILATAYNSSPGGVQFEDAVSAFATYTGTGAAGVLTAIFAGAPTLKNGTSPLLTDIFMQDNSGCGATECDAWTYGSSHLDATENLFISGTVAAEGNLLNTTNVVAFSATPIFDTSKGDLQKITLTGNVTSSDLTNCPNGWRVTFDIIEDATGGHTFTPPANLHLFGTIDTTANKHNIQNFYCDGTGGMSGGYATGVMVSGT